jgi:rRNA maturation RNase YbeY
MDRTRKFQKIKDKILGKDYDLSWAFISPEEIQKMNLTYRKMDKPTDILSFPLSETEGEIYLCEEEARKEAVNFDRDYDNFIDFLFIHGCVHLKGYDHGSTMERIEAKFRKEFGI